MNCQEPGGPGAPNDYGNHPRSKVPAELVGKYWHYGSFSMNQYSKYDGSYAGHAQEISTGYRFVNENGDAEQYFYWSKNSTYCRDQVLGYRKGTVVFDTEKKTFTFYAAKGNYRRYDACGSSQSPGYGQTKEYSADDLYPKYKAEYTNWAIVKENGKTIWRIPFDDGSKLDFTQMPDPQ
ncbi:hypothetical protein GCM10027275_07750 [Rhabdobacter roseus]|uniref:Uncharacterized protein n=1 Tax=Rhabdobacter roseus TaxID=1655419 RepID=A0A840TGS3_9BACT|nr:hypothetical protein [Rhabdobacter roseus]MBB5282674.1 hypothetical protein [Rhabdobacter roseus]